MSVTDELSPISANIDADTAAGFDTPLTTEDIAFSATALNGTEPYSYSWSFGDGGATGQTVSHAFAAAGTYIPLS